MSFRGPSSRVALPIAVVALGLLHAARAEACAACACGDPTLVAAGTEQPFAGRLRASIEVRHRTDRIGQPRVDEIAITEERASAGLAWAPASSWFLIASAPLVQRRARDPNLREYQAFGLSEIEARAKWYFYRDRELAPRFLAAATAGLKLPTAALRRDASGELLPLEAQLGTGSWDALAGLSAALFAERFSAYTSVEVAVPFATREHAEPGVATRATLAAQYQPWPSLALRPLLETRFERKSRIEGELDENSGGSVVFAGADVLVSPLTDLTLGLGGRYPILSALNGYHEEGGVLFASAAFDF